jgi:hypothetical protein
MQFEARLPSYPIPLRDFGVTVLLQSIHDEAAQAVAALEIDIHDFKADFIDAGAAQERLARECGAHRWRFRGSLPCPRGGCLPSRPYPPPRLSSRTEMLDFPQELLMVEESGLRRATRS